MIRREIGEATEGEKGLLSAHFVVPADERQAQLVAVLVDLTSLLSRIGVELVLSAHANRRTPVRDEGLPS